MTMPETTDIPETVDAEVTDTPEAAPAPLPPPAVFAGFGAPDAPAEADMYRCVHCGLCLSACPTYGVTGLETESPRGRIALMKAVNEGRVDITPRIVSHWEACLNCRACEAVCPSGVPYGRMMERTRAQIRARRLKYPKSQRPPSRLMTRWLLRGLLPRPGLLRLAARMLWLYQRLHLQTIVRRVGILRRLPGNLAQMESQLPRISNRFFTPSRRIHQPDAPPINETIPDSPPPDDTHTAAPPPLKVALLSGCVMPLMQAPTMGAAVRTLTRNGCRVIAPPGQGCCGALNLHAGDLATARRMARRVIDAMLRSDPDRIVTCSAGCGAAMKEYPHLLQDDPVYADRARQAAAITQDITELLHELPFRPPQAELQRTVTYQDPCHLAHAQRINAAPRAILQAIPGVELCEMDNPSLCCGGAGIYPALQPILSQRILSRKLDAIAQTEAEEVITANPGCMLQLDNGLRADGRPIPVRHIVDLLDEAYSREQPPAVPSSRPRRPSRRNAKPLQQTLEQAQAQARRRK